MKSIISHATAYTAKNGDIILTQVPSSNKTRSAPELFSEENKAIDNLFSTLQRQSRKLMLYAIEYPFDYFVTISFDEGMSCKGLELADMFGKWLRDRARRFPDKLRYLLICLPMPSNPSVWHIHMLVAGIPAEEFVPLQECPFSLTRDAKLNIARGATPLGWPAVEKAFHAKTYVEKFGDRNEDGDVIEQYGKARYLSMQLLQKETYVDKYGNSCVRTNKIESVKNYQANYAPGARPYRRCGIEPPKKLTSFDVLTEDYEDLLKSYSTADISPRSVRIPAEEARKFLGDLTSCATW